MLHLSIKISVQAEDVGSWAEGRGEPLKVRLAPLAPRSPCSHRLPARPGHVTPRLGAQKTGVQSRPPRAVLPAVLDVQVLLACVTTLEGVCPVRLEPVLEYFLQEAGVAQYRSWCCPGCGDCQSVLVVTGARKVVSGYNRSWGAGLLSVSPSLSVTLPDK